MKEVYRATVSLREFSNADKRLYVSAWITVWKCVITFLKPFETKMPEIIQSEALTCSPLTL